MFGRRRFHYAVHEVPAFVTQVRSRGRWFVRVAVVRPVPLNTRHFLGRDASTKVVAWVAMRSTKHVAAILTLVVYTRAALFTLFSEASLLRACGFAFGNFTGVENVVVRLGVATFMRRLGSVLLTKIVATALTGEREEVLLFAVHAMSSEVGELHLIKTCVGLLP